MRKLSIIFLILIMGLAAGCKLEHNSRIRQSQLLGEIQTIEVQARVEVSACNSYKDKTAQSDSLIKVNNLMKKILPDSEYEGCKQEGMKSIATYNTLMDVGTLPPGVSEYESKGVSIVRNHKGGVFFCLSKEIRSAIAESRKSTTTKDIVLDVNIRFANDTEKEINILPHGIFVDGKPFAGFSVWGNNIIIQPKEFAVLTLSDVSSEYAIAYGISPVFSEVRENTDSAEK